MTSPVYGSGAAVTWCGEGDGNGADGRTVIVAVSLAGIAHTGGLDVTGQYLASYDPDAFGGLGWADWTWDADRALVFDSKAAAYTFYTQTSTVQPVRPDGQPNRPLCAFTVAFVPAPA